MTSSTVVWIAANPPVGWAKTVSHTRHLTTVAALLNTICSLRHFLHFTFRNLLFGPSMITKTSLAYHPLKASLTASGIDAFFPSESTATTTILYCDVIAPAFFIC